MPVKNITGGKPDRVSFKIRITTNKTQSISNGEEPVWAGGMVEVKQTNKQTLSAADLLTVNKFLQNYCAQSSSSQTTDISRIFLTSRRFSIGSNYFQ